ncbi:MAG: hypothetical protein ACPGOY_12960 [Rhodospirillaceae bacterium]
MTTSPVPPDPQDLRSLEEALKQGQAMLKSAQFEAAFQHAMDHLRKHPQIGLFREQAEIALEALTTPTGTLPEPYYRAADALAWSLPTESEPILLAIKAATLARFYDDADAALTIAVRLCPDRPALVWRWCLSALRPHYPDQQALERARQAFTSRSRSLEATVAQALAEPAPGGLSALHWRSLVLREGAPLLLAFQGQNDRALLEQHGRILSQIAAKALPEAELAALAPRPRAPVTAQQSFRLGIVSALVRRHTCAKLHLGWLQGLDQNRIEVTLFDLSEGVEADDPLALAWRQAVPTYHPLPRDPLVAAQTIRAAQLDAVLYPEVGIDPLVRLLAARRMAPWQMTSAFGQPHTTGLAAMDLFLSAQAMEPVNGQEHYCEDLIRLPGIEITPTAPAPPHPEPSSLAEDRAHFGLPTPESGLVLFLCAQNACKYLPAHDGLFPAIAKRLPEARFVLLTPGRSPLFDARLDAAFQQENLDPNQYVIRLPQLDPMDYQRINRCCDLYLDSLEWSGGMTTLDALFQDLIPLTCPGTLMRGLHTLAMLRMLGLERELSVETPEALVDLAVLLAQDPDRRVALRQTIRSRKTALFQDRSAVDALTDLLVDLPGRVARQDWPGQNGLV